LMWGVFTACTIFVLVWHRRQPVALMPSSWLGKGQLLYLLFLWLIVIANFTKALTGFQDGRIATEGVTMFNALICTVLILACARPAEEIPEVREPDYARFSRTALWLLGASLVVTTTLYTAGIRGLYGSQPTGWGGGNLRFGDNADWRVKPIVKSKPHR
jgi:hypothetical protein